MKKPVLDFINRGLIAGSFGPLVLVFFYLIMQREAGVEILTVNQVCLGIISLTALAFIAGGMNVVYQIERLPLMLAIMIHGLVLYISYLAAYLINGWLEQGITPFLVFTIIFIIGYLAIWAIIYTVTRRKTARLNEMLMQKQSSTESTSC